MKTESLGFTTQDLELFSSASHDRNPLHTSGDYARKTPYGEPVVYGMLGAFGALAALPDQLGMVLDSVDLEFRNPLFVGVRYRREASEIAPGQFVVKLYDGKRLMMKGAFTFLQSDAQSWAVCGGEPYLEEPADYKPGDLKKGLGVSGMYAPYLPDFEKVIERWDLASKGTSGNQIVALMWASFVVGMRLPGKRATFWRVVLHFRSNSWSCEGPLSYQARVQEFDERVNVLRTTAELSCRGLSCGSAEMWSFIRDDCPQPSLERISELLRGSESLQGKTALVIGGSRGLGAAISQALALRGCHVFINYQRSQADAERLMKSIKSARGRVELARGDAADVQWCENFLDTISRKTSGLDIVVYNACPSIRPLDFSSDAIERFQDFVTRTLALVIVPMSVLAPIVSQRYGWNIIVSSEFVRTTPVEWPHYVTAKAAVEGLARWASAQDKHMRYLVVRPPKLLTDQTNTPAGRQGAMRVEDVASAIARYVCHPTSSQGMQILETF